MVRVHPGPLSADLHRFHGCVPADIGRSVSLLEAARWATNLPGEAVMWRAIREADEAKQASSQQAKKDATAAQLAAMQKRRKAELEGGG